MRIFLENTPEKEAERLKWQLMGQPISSSNVWAVGDLMRCQLNMSTFLFGVAFQCLNCCENSCQESKLLPPFLFATYECTTKKYRDKLCLLAFWVYSEVNIFNIVPLSMCVEAKFKKVELCPSCKRGPMVMSALEDKWATSFNVIKRP